MSATTEYTHQEPPLVLREPLGHTLPVGSRARRPLQPWLTKRGRVVRSHTRAALIWCNGFVVFGANEHSQVAAAALAAVAAFVWSTLCQRAADAARVKRIAFGTAATTVAGILAGFVVLSAISFIAPQLGLQPQGLALIALLSVVLVTAAERVLDRAIPNRNRLLIVGADPLGVELLETIATGPKSTFDIVGLIDDERDADQIAGVPIQGKIADLADVVRREQPDLIVVAVTRSRPEVFAQLLEVAEEGFSVVGLPEFYEQAFGRLPIRHLTPAWFMSVFHLYQRPYTRVVKRTFDLIVASIGLVILAPLFPLIALLVRLTPGPAIYRQVRLGEGGRPFTILKFRTMRVDAEANGHAWATEQDPRINRLGRVLRKTRLDEIPQLWNVLKGDMSIVGPRPERPEYLEELSNAVPYWTSRHLLKPGITGWAQVSDGYASDHESSERKLSYDLWYLRHQSLAVDLLVAAKTISKLSSGSSGGR